MDDMLLQWLYSDIDYLADFDYCDKKEDVNESENIDKICPNYTKQRSDND